MVQKGKDLKPGLQLGKYRLLRRLGLGGFGEVWQAQDSIEGIRVALKFAYDQFTDVQSLEAFREEARIQATLDHPHILKIKSAEFIDDHFVIASDLGRGTLATLLRRALPVNRALFFFRQALDALAYAHEHKVLHRDIKPENFLFFKKDHLRLGDFGISKILAAKKHTATVAGTLGYMAPEQAYGRPTMASDVFSLGLLLYWMLSGQTAQWPFVWPFKGYALFRKKTPASLEHFLRKACAFAPEKRFKNAIEMKEKFSSLEKKLLRELRRSRSNHKPKPNRRRSGELRWQELRRREFKRRYGKALQLRYSCRQCDGPLAEFMPFCPWCRDGRNRFTHESHYPDTCENCHRGVKEEWRFCPWCFGPGFREYSDRIRPDERYTARCTNRKCPASLLMPFMRYCPWCHQKVKRPWRLRQLKESCPKCAWGVALNFWDFCPWCSTNLKA